MMAELDTQDGDREAQPVEQGVGTEESHGSVIGSRIRWKILKYFVPVVVSAFSVVVSVCAIWIAWEVSERESEVQADWQSLQTRECVWVIESYARFKAEHPCKFKKDAQGPNDGNSYTVFVQTYRDNMLCDLEPELKCKVHCLFNAVLEE